MPSIELKDFYPTFRVPLVSVYVVNTSSLEFSFPLRPFGFFLDTSLRMHVNCQNIKWRVYLSVQSDPFEII